MRKILRTIRRFIECILTVAVVMSIAAAISVATTVILSLILNGLGIAVSYTVVKWIGVGVGVYAIYKIRR